MAMTIYSDNSIELDGKKTALRVTQRSSGTVVYSADHGGENYREYDMPHQRYSLSHDKPASGAAGRAQFESDIRALCQSRNSELLKG
jgi:hypothetical protein